MEFKETAPEALYYEMAKLMATFMLNASYHSELMGFLDSHCEPLSREFEKVMSEVKERSAELFIEDRE